MTIFFLCCNLKENLVGLLRKKKIFSKQNFLAGLSTAYRKHRIFGLKDIKKLSSLPIQFSFIYEA